MRASEELAGWGLGAIVLLFVVVVGLRRRRQPTEERVSALDSLLTAARRRAVLAVVFAAVVLLTLFVFALAVPSLLGLPFVMAGGLAGAAGLSLYAATPPQADPILPGERRSASLTPRSPVSFVSRPAVVALSALLLLQVGFMILTGATSSPDERGLYRAISFATPDQASSASPYAGWYYSAPWLLATVVLIACLVFALRRVSATPALSSPELSVIDAAWRRGTTRILCTIAGVALALPLGGASFVSGSAMRRASLGEGSTVWTDVGTVMQVSGALLLVGSLVQLVVAASWALSLPRRVSAQQPEVSRSNAR